jgi:hypothetical protein
MFGVLFCFPCETKSTSIVHNNFVLMIYNLEQRFLGIAQQKRMIVNNVGLYILKYNNPNCSDVANDHTILVCSV